MIKKLYSYDKGNNKVLCNLEDVCDFNVSNVFQLLNSLAEENEQLKKTKYEYKQDWKQASVNCDLYKQEISFLKDEIKGFREENGELRSKIGEQQATISALQTENNHLIDVIKEYANKYEEQQAIIQKQERRIEILENLLTNMGVKWVGDDD